MGVPAGGQRAFCGLHGRARRKRAQGGRRDVHQLHVRDRHRQGQQRVYRLHHPHGVRATGAGRGAAGQRDRLPARGACRKGEGVHRPERRGEQRAGPEVERDEELR